MKVLALVVSLAALLGLPAPASASLTPTVQFVGWDCEADEDPATGDLVVDLDSCSPVYRFRSHAKQRRSTPGAVGHSLRAAS